MSQFIIYEEKPIPLYDFKCPQGHVSEQYAKMDEMVKPCPDCGADMKRLITSRIYLQTDYASSDFVTPDITGSDVRITSRKQMRELCKQHDVMPKEGKPANSTYEKRVSNKLQDRWI